MSSETPTGRRSRIYSRENEAEARQAKVLTADEARRIAVKRGCRSCWGRVSDS
jgi:hypothetical protein